MNRAFIAILLVLSQGSWASGSLDYICWSGPLRYSYSNGEETSASLFTVAGLDVKKATKLLVEDNTMDNLDAFAIADLLVQANVINFNDCEGKTTYTELDGKCPGRIDDAKIDDAWSTAPNKYVKKVDVIHHMNSRKDGTAVTLNIQDFGHSDDDVWTGTIKVQSKDPVFAKYSSDTKVECRVSSP